MYDKQFLQKPIATSKASFPTRSSQKELMQLWLEGDINESYQKIVLRYLDQLQSMHQWIEIEKQLKQTYERSNYFYKISNRCQKRAKDLEQLSLEVIQLDEWTSKMEDTKYPRLEYICELLNEVRENSMVICEEVSAMFQKFKYDPQKKPSLGSYYLLLFRNFYQNIKFLKDSSLSNYIPFSENYDPLFIQALKKNQQQLASKKIIYDHNVKQLFQLNASYMYRLLRAHQKMLNYTNLSYQIKEEEPEPFNESFGENKFNRDDYDTPPAFKDKKVKTINDIKIKDPRIMNKSQIEPLSQENQEKDRVRQRKLVHNTPYLKKGNINQSPQSSPSIFVQKNGIYQLQDLSQTVSKRRYKFNSNRSKTIQYQVDKTPSNKFYNSITKNEAKSVHLPKLSKVSFQRPDHYRQETNCFCRKKIKHQVNSQPFAELTEEEYEEKRKSIIRTVREKYRQLAKKQIQYELSKLGDRTYHQMKSRFGKKK